MEFFNDGQSKTEATYVVAKYSKIRNNWFEQYEYEEIEDAYAKIQECRKYYKLATYGVFEKIKSECINQIHDSYLDGLEDGL